MLGLGAVLAVIVLFLRHNVPESPRWLRLRGRHQEADEVMTLIHILHEDAHSSISTTAATDAAADANWADSSIPPEVKNHELYGTWWEMFTPRMIRATFFLCYFLVCFRGFFLRYKYVFALDLETFYRR